MSNNFFQNETLKSVLVGGYRAYAMSLVTRSGPRVFVNSVPKAGTHLFTSILEEMPGMMNSGLHIQTRVINELAAKNERIAEYKLDTAKFDRYARTIRPGQYFSSHIFWDESAKDYLRGTDLKFFFITRDPRDILVSSYHYIMGLRRHFLHDYVAAMPDPIDRYKFILYGKDSDPYKPSQKVSLEGFLPWMEQDFVCHVTFEDLVGAQRRLRRGTGSDPSAHLRKARNGPRRRTRAKPQTGQAQPDPSARQDRRLARRTA